MWFGIVFGSMCVVLLVSMWLEDYQDRRRFEAECADVDRRLAEAIDLYVATTPEREGGNDE